MGFDGFWYGFGASMRGAGPPGSWKAPLHLMFGLKASGLEVELLDELANRAGEIH